MVCSESREGVGAKEVGGILWTDKAYGAQDCAVGRTCECDIDRSGSPGGLR